MIKQLSTLLCLLAICFFSAQAQNTGKLDLETTLRLSKGQVTNGTQHLLVKGDVGKIKQLVKAYGGHYKYSYGNIASVEIPDAKLLAFANEVAVWEIQNPNTTGHLLMDTARIRNNVDAIHAGLAPLPRDIKGRGVIVGIIDGGIYWQHPDFKDANGNTRIRYIWDETYLNGTAKPQPYNYGNEWNWQELNNNNCPHTEPAADSSHGTCVTGVAAGNGLSLLGDSLSGDSTPEKRYVGIAPESEIIFVRVDVNASNFDARIADAVDYIFKKADALGRACVINTSIGSYTGPHDGKDLTSQVIENLLNERNGRAMVAAAGNAGNINFHLGYNVPPDSAYTMFAYNYSRNGVYFDLWADTASFKNVQFAVGCNDSNGVNLARTRYYNILADFNPSQGTTASQTPALLDLNQLLGNIYIQATLLGSRYHVEFFVAAAAPLTNLWRLQTKGSGKFDLWSHPTLTKTSSIVTELNGSSLDATPNYKLPDNDKTTTGGWQCNDMVITVGNYSSRANYLDVDSNVVDMANAFPIGETVGRLYTNSSAGPTRDGRTKPDLVATGNTIICTGNLTDINYRLNNNQRYMVGYGGKHRRNGGTSLSSAIVTGIAALYLEKRPTANWNEIKTALICTAVKDSFTTNDVNNNYGNGKVNGFAALTQTNCITFGAVDTICINYNPQANVDSGTCIAKVYGCTDSTADNYNPLANVSDGSCTFTGIRNVFGANVTMQVVPNPFSTQTTFKFNGLNFEAGEIRILNQMGATVEVLKLIPGRTEYTLNNDKLAKGIYYYLLNADGKNVKAGKLVAE